MREAAYYRQQPDGTVRCMLCPHACQIADGATGICRARRHAKGTLVAESYAQVTTLALDPIEKKPLRHFHPGTLILSAGSYGCNLRCPFCQNYSISMETPACRTIPPAALVATSREMFPQGNIGLAFTYNEPLVGYEYVLDCAKLARADGQEVVLVTNGYCNRQPLQELLPYVSAMNIDLKAFREDTYRWLGGGLAAVQQSIALAAAHCHLEVTTLVLPGRNDSPQEIDSLAAWLAAIRPDIPLHINRFFPRHEMQGESPTPVETILQLAETARAHLRYVYPGNC